MDLLKGLDFSKSLLGSKDSSQPPKPDSPKKAIHYESTIDAVLPKDGTLSSGKQIRLKPRGNRDSLAFLRPTGSDDDPSNASIDASLEAELGQPIDMSSLRRRLEIRDVVSKQELSVRGRFKAEFKPGKSVANSLWTEKYRPQSFFDLLGNEKTNRRILSWLNQWNNVVFKKPTPEMMMPDYLNEKDQLQQRQPQQRQDPDPLHRPYRRVLLIHGPPGTGKTSIAHVIANQLGYEISEINASDERAGAIVRAKLRNSVQNQSLSGKPVCLIADEVDGASEQGFVRCLVDMIYKDHRATKDLIRGNKAVEYGRKRSDKDRRSSRYLLRRPIIAICNDLYANALEKLRGLCEVVPFRKSTKRQVKTRLRRICKDEGFSTVNEKILEALVTCSDGDVRSCINFLQFHGCNAEDMDISGKDTQIAWYLLADSIFFRHGRTSKPQQREKVHMDVQTMDPSQLRRVLSSCFNAILECPTVTLSKLDATSSWLYFGDIISRKYRTFSTRREVGSYEGAVINQLFETFNDVESFLDGSNRLSFGSRDEFGELRKQSFNTITKLRKTPNLRLSSDELPILASVVIPTQMSIRTLENAPEKIDHAVEVLDKLGFHYETHSQDANSQAIPVTFFKKIHSIEPNLATFIVSDTTIGKQDAIIQRLQTHYLHRKETERALEERERKRKQAEESRGLNLERERKRSKKNHQSIEFFNRKYHEISSRLSHSNAKGSTHRKGGQILGMLQGRQEESKMEDNENAEELPNKGGVMSANENRIWIKYHEGFSNAVRKEITWDMLF